MKIMLLKVIGFIIILNFFSFNFNASDGISEKVVLVFKKYGCVNCHSNYSRLIGPSFRSIALRNYSLEKIADLIANPQPTNWPGYSAMAPILNVTSEDVKIIADWFVILRAE